MKNGMASRTKLSMPRAICWAKMTPGRLPSTQMKTSAARASAKPIGRPPHKGTKKPSSTSAIGGRTEAGVARGGDGAGGAEEARADHEAAGPVVGPFARRVEPRPQQHRDDDDDEIRRQQESGDGIGQSKQHGPRLSRGPPFETGASRPPQGEVLVVQALGPKQTSC